MTDDFKHDLMMKTCDPMRTCEFATADGCEAESGDCSCAVWDLIEQLAAANVELASYKGIETYNNILAAKVRCIEEEYIADGDGKAAAVDIETFLFARKCVHFVENWECADPNAASIFTRHEEGTTSCLLCGQNSCPRYHVKPAA